MHIRPKEGVNFYRDIKRNEVLHIKKRCFEIEFKNMERGEKAREKAGRRSQSKHAGTAGNVNIDVHTRQPAGSGDRLYGDLPGSMGKRERQSGQVTGEIDLHNLCLY